MRPLTSGLLQFLFLFTLEPIAADDDFQSDLTLVRAYVELHANDTFREPTGFLKHPYLVPAGPYEQCWDWDAVFTGVALLDLGAAPYLAGSMMNFFEATDLQTGNVTQCLDPTTLTPTCSSSNESEAVAAHAKPLLIQGALFAARALNEEKRAARAARPGDSRAPPALENNEREDEEENDDGFSQFLPYEAHMRALLRFWDRERLDEQSGLYTWHDQMESGADNLVTSQCPSSRSQDCWNEASDANTLAAADTAVELLRERRAFAVFLDAWGNTSSSRRSSSSINSGRRQLSTGNGRGRADVSSVHEEEEEEEEEAAGGGRGATAQRSRAESLATRVNEHLWDDEQGCFVALNTSSQSPIDNSVYLAAFPLWGGAGVVSAERASRVASRVSQEDLLSAFGLRSTSSKDPRYSNENTIYPYSNWRGPVWVVANAVVAYGLAAHGFKDLALDLATRTTALLASDLRATGTWHECYDSSDGGNGQGLAADGFLSWNTLGYRLVEDISLGVNPFEVDSYPGMES